ncbi:MAG: hypothetical protein JWM74_5434 [Myxococcaceae bacterium]|nr:hypothetical protein [Myxococcaceae bacterium]
MSAAHKIVGWMGIAVSLAFAVTLRTSADTLGADASEPPYTGLWIYTPYVAPAEGVQAKVFLQGGDGVDVLGFHASIDGAPVAVEDRHDRERRPSKRFDMGKLEIEFRAVVPNCTTRGEHSLAIDVETRCAGSSYSKACGVVHLEAPIDVGSTSSRVYAALRALGAALLVVFALRRGWDPMKRWVGAAEKSGSVILAPTGIAIIIVWAWCSYPLFARPLGAALGSSSDVLYGVAIVAWLGLWPVAVRTRHRVWGTKRGSSEAPSHASVHVLEDPNDVTVDSGAAGYRDAPEKKPVPRARVSLDDVAKTLYATHFIRYRRSGNRLVPRWFGSAPVTFEADDGDDVARGIALKGHYGFILAFAVSLAKKLGRLELTLDGKTVTVETNDAPLDVKQRLDAVSRDAARG